MQLQGNISDILAPSGWLLKSLAFRPLRKHGCGAARRSCEDVRLEVGSNLALQFSNLRFGLGKTLFFRSHVRTWEDHVEGSRCSDLPDCCCIAVFALFFLQTLFPVPSLLFFLDRCDVELTHFWVFLTSARLRLLLQLALQGCCQWQSEL